MRSFLLLVALAGCSPETSGEDNSACLDTCGTTWTGDTWLTCDPCLDEDTIHNRMRGAREVFDLMWSRSYMQDVRALDREAILDHAAQAFRTEPNHQRARRMAEWRVVQAFGNGHSGIGHTSFSCEEVSGVDLGTTRYGTCVVPAGEDFVVTGTSDSLGLQPGDRITAVNGLAGATLVEWLLDGPLCGAAAGNPDASVDLAADALMASLRPGDQLTVVDLAGDTRQVRVGTPGAQDGCRSFSPTWIDGYQRADGVAVLSIRRWIIYNGETGHDDDPWVLIDAMIDQAEEIFDRIIPDARGLVFDIRGNSGGASAVGFALAEGMPGAHPYHLATCRGRIPDTTPLAYTSPVLRYDLEPRDRFVFQGPVALLTDGHSVSASDYFALALQQTTDARLFGRTTRGAYGGGPPSTELDNTPDGVVYIDTARCDDASGEPLETLGVKPDVFLDPHPADVAAGIDTVLEAAAAWALDQP